MPEYRIKAYKAKIKNVGLKGEELLEYIVTHFQELGFPKRGTAVWFYHNCL